jgi:hypothetical protein
MVALNLIPSYWTAIYILTLSLFYHMISAIDIVRCFSQGAFVLFSLNTTESSSSVLSVSS